MERIAAVDVFDWSDETFQGCVDIAREALSTTEQTGAERVRELWALNTEEGNRADEEYLAGIVDTLNALGITIPGINTPKGDGNDV